MFKKIVIGVILVVLIGGATACGGNRPAPVPTPAPGPAPSNSNSVTQEKTNPEEAKIIEITAEELIRQLQANPDKYKKGQVFQVSGTVIETGRTYHLGPEVNGWFIQLEYNPQKDGGLHGVGTGRKVVVRGEYDMAIASRIILARCILISRE